MCYNISKYIKNYLAFLFRLVCVCDLMGKMWGVCEITAGHQTQTDWSGKVCQGEFLSELGPEG